MSAHTPGPWHLTISHDTQPHWISGSWQFPRPIARITNYDGALEHTDRARDEANAHLIVAAPALLEALEALMSVLDRGYEVTLLATDQARAAIAQAKGDTK